MGRLQPCPAPCNARARGALLAQADALEAQARVLRALAEDIGEEAPEPAPEVMLVGRAEMARRLDVSIATVDRLDAQGQPHVRVGDSKKYDVAEVLAWHRQRTASEPKAPLLPAPESAPSGVRRVSRGGARGGAS